MSKWLATAPWKPIEGKGQSLALTNGASAKFTNAVGANTHCVMLSASGGNCTVRISGAGDAATATDFLIKATDPPVPLGCAEGDSITAWGLSAGVTLYLSEMTH